MSGSDRSFNGRYGWECPDCGAVVSLWDREFHRNVMCSESDSPEVLPDGGTDSTDTERDQVVELVALLDEVERRFCDLGHQQTMSVGPVLSDVKTLRESVVQRGKGYGILPQSESVMELRADANDLDVSVTASTEADRDE